VIQLARQFGVQTINVIRKREDADEQRLLEDELKTLGADHVITEDDLRNADRMEAIWSTGVNKPRLALNCVNGKNATDCVRHLAPNGTMVTYGGMSRQPLIIPTGSLIFLNHKFQGFWMTQWYKQYQQKPEEQEMLTFISESMLNRSLQVAAPITFRFEQFKEAVETSMQSNVRGKVTLIN
jgi:trans-2-enoyl-CoA reductase